MNLTLRTFVVLMLGLHVTEAAAVAADRANWAPEAGQSEPVIPGTRVQPPTADDLTFVYDVGQGLDTNCLYHSEGPIVITLPISRVVGDVSKQVDANLNPTAELLIAAYDVDSDASIPPLWPERDRIRINGHVVPGEFLTGFNEAWKINAFPIPIEWLHFSSDPGKGGSPNENYNTVQIDIDTANNSGGTGINRWCTSIDWVCIRIRVPRPVVLVHGILSSSEVWTPNCFVSA